MVGSASYSNRNQLVPEFAGSVPAPNLPGRVNFRFDKFAVGVVQRFTPWITATGVVTVESEAHMHSRCGRWDVSRDHSCYRRSTLT